MIRVWDPLVRIFHWGLVVAVAVAWLSSEGWDDLHAITGYIMLGLLAVRLIWGVVGSRYARFTQFLRAPKTVIAYLRELAAQRERRYLGHNPAGGMMILALMLTLAGTGWTGWLLEDPTRLAALPDMPQIIAPAHADEHGDGGEGEGGLIGDLHEMLANFVLILIVLHLGGVAVASLRHRENLVRAMVTGDKRAPEAGDVT